MKSNTAIPAVPEIEPLIRTLREQRVILDADLARVYGVTTKALNQAVKRNADRFPDDFMFQLTSAEKTEVVTNCDHLKRLKFSPVLPFAFTEHGSIMAANVLNSPRAVQMSVFVVRAFVGLRRLVTDHDALSRKLIELERRVEGHDRGIKSLFDAIRQLMSPPVRPRREIGFHARPESPAADAAKGKKAFAGRRAAFKAEEKKLEEARSARLPFKQLR